MYEASKYLEDCSSGHVGEAQRHLEQQADTNALNMQYV